MPVVGFHQARRPRQSPGERLRREFSWPRPGGVMLSCVGAALVVGGALGLAGSTEPVAGPQPALSTVLRTTPGTPWVPSASSPLSTPAKTASSSDSPSSSTSWSSPSASESSSAASKLAVSGGSATPLPPSATPTPPLIKGAAKDSPVHKAFASGASTPKDRSLLNIFNPKSPLVLVNKHHALAPLKYSPSDLIVPAIPEGSGEPGLLRAEAATAAERMFTAAAAQGVQLSLLSSYRSYDTQMGLYRGYVATKGSATADTTSARPGFSEHQSGLAMDIGDAGAGTACEFHSCFAETAGAQWVAAHAHEHGFVVRYGPGSESTTGYAAEPWHLRYVGVAVAEDMLVRGFHSYEEYLGLPGAPGYK